MDATLPYQELFDGYFKNESECFDSLKLPAVRGIVFFIGKENQPVQLLITGNIRKAIYSRLQAPENHSQKTNISEVVTGVLYKECFNTLYTQLSFLKLAKIIYPATWKTHIKIPKLYFLEIDISDVIPVFRITDRISKRHLFGPFINRRSASHYLSSLETLFNLCKQPGIRNSPAKARSCPYFQMKTCPAPCIHPSAQTAYHESVKKAISFINRQFNPQSALLTQMESCIQNKEFEKAQLLKQKIEATQHCLAKPYENLSPAESISIIHIDKSKRIKPEASKKNVQFYQGFFITINSVIILPDFSNQDKQQFSESLKHLIQTHTDQNPTELSDETALALSCMYKKNAKGLWIFSKSKNGQEILNHIDEYIKK